VKRTNGVIGVRENTAVVHDRLRREILQGDRAADSVISQVQVAEDLGVSRGPVREALRMLQREGLIEAETNHRARVAPFSPDDLESLYALRIVNEALGIRASVERFSDDELGTFQELLKEMELLRETGDIDAWEAPHQRFHRLLVSHAGSRITMLIGQLADHSGRYRHLYITGAPRAWSVGRAEHEEIVSACVDRDAPRATRLLAEHLASTALAVMSLREPERESEQIEHALDLILKA
jgi:DNA-binding GntR family transcriptional regulator